MSFLHAGEFIVNSTFDPEIHLSVCNLQVDCLLNPSCLKIRIKCSKNDPFRSGRDIYLGKGNSDISPLATTGSYLHVCGEAPGLFLFRDDCSFSEMEDLYCAKFWPPKSNTSCTLLVIPGLTLGTVFESMQPPQQPHAEYQIISSKPWAAGPVMLIKSTIEPPSHRLYRLPASYCSSRYVPVNWTVGCLRFPCWQWGCGFFATSPFAPSYTWRFHSAWAGAHGWVMDTAGHGSGSILQGLGCWPTVQLFWAPDLHL